MTEPEYKVLSDLRVTELKVELEKRGLDKNGIKIILSDRLEKAIRADGHDPATYKFCVSESVAAPTTPAKQKSGTPAPEKAESTEEPVAAEAPIAEMEAPLTVVAEEEKSEDAQVAAPVVETPQEPMDTKAPAAEEEQLDDPLDDKTESAKAAVAAAAEKKVDDIARSFWVRGLTPSIKAADLRELFSAYGKVARAKIFTSKKEPGKTFGLLTMAEASLVEACVAAMHGKQWNGMTITVEKGNQTNLTAAKTTVAANTAVKKPEPIIAPAKVDRKPEQKRDETAKNGREVAPPSSPSPAKDKEKNPREKIRRPIDRIAPSSARIRREPIRSARQDSRKTISAALTVTSRSGGISSRTASFRPAASLASRISRPGHPSTSRRPESYSSRSESGEVERIREEMRRRENDRQLERERERLRVERERIEREKLELQVMQQRQQLAALKASMEGSRSNHGESRHEHSSRSSSSRDKYAARPSRPEPRRDSSRDKMAGRPRVGRPDDRRPLISADRSRSRHDSRSQHDSHVRHEGNVRSDIRHDSHIRSEPRHEGHMRTDTRYDSRSDTRHDTSRHGGSTGRHSFPSRDAASSSVSGQQNYYGSRDSYASASREFDPSRAGTGSSWGQGQANWAGLPTDSWGVRSGGNGDWSSSGNYHSGSGASNIRIDYDKYRRQY